MVYVAQPKCGLNHIFVIVLSLSLIMVTILLSYQYHNMWSTTGLNIRTIALPYLHKLYCQCLR